VDAPQCVTKLYIRDAYRIFLGGSISKARGDGSEIPKMGRLADRLKRGTESPVAFLWSSSFLWFTERRGEPDTKDVPREM